MVKFQRLRISAIVCESKVVNASDAISHWNWQALIKLVVFKLVHS